MNTPVAFIIFNRPDLTELVFNAIRKARPARLYIIADGPRFEEEALITQQTRRVTEKVDWPCEVTRLYSEINLGCKRRVISGLNAVFEAEEQAIILEDDCMPHHDFFAYCTMLLQKFGDHPRIGTINGTCFPGFSNHFSPCQSYTFSQFSVIWGWATTQRVWKLVDPQIEEWERLNKSKWLKQKFPGQPDQAHGASRMFFHTRNGVDAWSYALLFALLRHNLVNVYPRINLISNIGFDPRAAHTHSPMPYSSLPTEPFPFSLPHLPEVWVDLIADAAIYKTLYAWNFPRISITTRYARKVRQKADRLLHRLIKIKFYMFR